MKTKMSSEEDIGYKWFQDSDEEAENTFQEVKTPADNTVQPKFDGRW